MDKNSKLRLDSIAYNCSIVLYYYSISDISEQSFQLPKKKQKTFNQTLEACHKTELRNPFPNVFSVWADMMFSHHRLTANST